MRSKASMDEIRLNLFEYLWTANTYLLFESCPTFEEITKIRGRFHPAFDDSAGSDLLLARPRVK